MIINVVIIDNYYVGSLKWVKNKIIYTFLYYTYNQIRYIYSIKHSMPKQMTQIQVSTENFGRKCTDIQTQYTFAVVEVA